MDQLIQRDVLKIVTNFFLKRKREEKT